MRGSNPVLSDRVFKNVPFAPAFSENVMTISGVKAKTFLLFSILLLGAYFTWTHPLPFLIYLGLIPGFILALVISFVPKTAPYFSPIYALCEGVFLGVISRIFEVAYRGIVFQAVFATLGVFLFMLFLYSNRIIKVTGKLKLGIMAATFGIGLLYFLSFILGFFGVRMEFIYSSSPIGILFSIFVVGVAAFNLLLDFDFIENMSNRGAPKYFEWYGAFGLMVTLVWLYIEILRLISKFRER